MARRTTGQCFFGARTGGANIIEGTLELTLGLLFAGSIAVLFGAFPAAIIGAMLEGHTQAGHRTPTRDTSGRRFTDKHRKKWGSDSWGGGLQDACSLHHWL